MEILELFEPKEKQGGRLHCYNCLFERDRLTKASTNKIYAAMIPKGAMNSDTVYRCVTEVERVLHVAGAC